MNHLEIFNYKTDDCRECFHWFNSSFSNVVRDTNVGSFDERFLHYSMWGNKTQTLRYSLLNYAKTSEFWKPREQNINHNL